MSVTVLGCGDVAVSIGEARTSVESSFRELDDVFLQTQTRIWLGEVLHMRFDEDIHVADLLADGKLLFQLSNVLWKMLLENSMKLGYSKSYIGEPFTFGKRSGRYMPYSNVDSFLKICQIMGLSGIDLFSPSDVVEKRDTRRVCMCIRSLSKKARFKDIQVPDFDIVTYTVSMPKDMVGCIRRSLEKSQWKSASSIDVDSEQSIVSKPKYSKKYSRADYVKDGSLHFEESDDAESYHDSWVNDSDSNGAFYQSGLDEAKGSYHEEHSEEDNNWVDEGDSDDAFLNKSMKLKLCTSHVDEEAIRTPSSTADNFEFSHLNPRDTSFVGDSEYSSTSRGGYIICQSDLPDFVPFSREFDTDFRRLDSALENTSYEFGKGLFDGNHDVEISSATSVSSSSCKIETYNYEDQLEAEDSSSVCSYDSYEFQELVDNDISVEKSKNDNSKLNFGTAFQDSCSSIKPRLDTEVADSIPNKTDLFMIQNPNNSFDKRSFVSNVDITHEICQSGQVKISIEEEMNTLVECSKKPFARNDSDPSFVLNIGQENLFDANGTTLDQTIRLQTNVEIFEEGSAALISGNVRPKDISDLSVSTVAKFESWENGTCKTATYTDKIVDNCKEQCSLDENQLGAIQLAYTGHDNTESWESIDEDKGHHEKDSIEASQNKPRKAILLKSVAGGMTFIGVFFLYFHLRNKGSQDKFSETITPSEEANKVRTGEAITPKRRQNGRVDGVYPGDKLKF